jgi:hypothetical protein
MNYFAHGRRFLDRPYFVAGTAIPDWLNVVNRRVRVRRKHVQPLLDSDNPIYRDLAAGVAQHHVDDDWFHRTRAFTELSLEFAVILRDQLPADDGFRPSFLGHILVEILLDDCLAAEEPVLLANYYETVAATDPRAIAQFVHEVTGKPVDPLADFIPRFIEVRFLYDYADNVKLLYRLNQVMGRVGLVKIPDTMIDLLPRLRSAVRERRHELLSPGTE